MILRSVTINLASLLCLAALACKSSQGETAKESDTSTPSDEEDDDTVIAEGVPMSLIGPEFLASIDTKLTPSIAAGSYADLAAEPRGSIEPNPRANRYAVAQGVLAASGRTAGEMRRLLATVQGLLKDTFGPAGFFRGEDVQMPRGTTQRMFALPPTAGSSRYAVVFLNDQTGYRYGVDLYDATPDGRLERSTRLEFDRLAEAGGAKVRFEHAQTDPATGTIQRIVATYNTREQAIDTAFGYETAPTTMPAKTLVRFVSDAAGSADLFGAYVWRRPTTVTTGLIPRYYDPQSGDVELFMSRSRTSASAEAAQKLAFVPVEALVDPVVSTGVGAFDRFGYPTLMLDFLRQLVRHPQINPDCAQAGAVFKSAFTEGTAPPAVAAAPTDLCQTNAALTDAAVEAIVDAVCRAGVDIVLKIKESEQATTLADYSLCERHHETLLLANPQFFYTDQGSRILVEPPEMPRAEHTALAAELGMLSFIDFSALQDVTWTPLPSRPASDFAGAEPMP